MQVSAVESQPAIFDADKKQKFGVSDNGEFIDTVYREQESSKLFGKLIGRNYVQPNAKKVFTTADIVCEGYLHKKGSWMKNWKKRYFILRKDIRSLCYYASREDLTLLGTIPLDIETTLTNVKSEDADGFGHVIAMQTEHDNGSSSITYIRFDSFEKMKAWMIDIKNEAHNMKPTDEDTADWWHALFNDIEPVEPKSNAIRREGLTTDMGTGKASGSSGGGGARPVSIKRPASSPRAVASQEKGGSSASSAGSPSSSASPPEFVNASASLLDEPSKAKLAEKLKSNAIVDSDDEKSDEEDTSGKAGHGGAPNSGVPTSEKAHRKSGLIAGQMPRNKKIKMLKQEKPHGPAPFDAPTIERFETPRGDLVGYQLSLRLCNVCGFQDRIFVVVFGSVSTVPASIDKRATSPLPEPHPSPAMSSSHKTAAAPPAPPLGTPSAVLQGGSKWTQISRTELRTVTDKPEYGENYVNDFKIHFSIMEDRIPEHCKDIKIAVYRLENEMNPKEPAKATNLNMQLEIARTIISRKLFEAKSPLKVSMQVKIELPMDIAIPLFKESEVTLGVLKMTSHSLYQQRKAVSTFLRCSPYAEILYSFCTNSGQTLSLEQLYASRYSVSVAQGLLSLWHQERTDYMEETLQMLREEFAFAVRDQQQRQAAGQMAPGESVEDKVNGLFEPFRQAIDAMDDIFTSSEENDELVLNNCDNACAGTDLMNNVLPPACGGGVLRRSTWKKITAWQYCTTNLNVHLMTSKHFSFNEVLSGTESDARTSVHYIPTITLGVPSAHELKFHEGGLRKIFNDITDTDMKLQWMQAFQAPTLEPLKMLFQSHPREAQLLFGPKFNSSAKEDLASVLKRKYELMKRIDICGSQALGCAITVVKTVIMLASQHHGSRYLDILARSLKIGFLVLFESMLSTQGDELGMIEDMDLAVLWLSLVTVRLVQYPSAKEDASKPAGENTALSKIFSVQEVPIHVGKGEGVSCRRDATGRLIVDLVVNAQEAAAITEARKSMDTFEQRATHHLRRDVPYCFDSNPIVDYAKDEIKPTVFAVVELFGIVFTQGVNEMQTLCNLSSSRDVARQVEINFGSLSRFIEFYRNYRAALEYQLVSKTPELLEVLNHSAAAAQANMINSAFAGAGPSTSRGSAAATLPTAVRARRKSLRSSVSNAFINNSNEGLNAAAESLKVKVLNANDRMLDQVHEAIASSTATPHDKHVDVLLKTSALCREIGGTVAILCKSGKDRTSMGVTLENTRALVEDLGVLNGQEVCQTMRQQGVRRMNVYANTGQPMFAFNQIQRIALPSCYRPPPGSHAGNITS